MTFDEKFFHHSFVYPDFSAEVGALQDFIAADLIEVSMKKALEKLGECLQYEHGTHSYHVGFLIG